MSINWFEWNGVRSDSMELLIAEKRIYGAPQRDFELVHVPGRDGDVLIDHGGWKNVDVSYTVQFVGLPEKAPTLRQWLQGTGYGVLRDSYRTGYFRYGVFTSILDPEEIARNVGRLQVVFSCKPYLYREPEINRILLSTSGTTVTNPEDYASEPYMRIAGSGNMTLYIGSKAYALKNVNDYVILDSAQKCAFCRETLCNDKLLFTQFPTLEPGDNVIQWTENVTNVVIDPRWRTI